MSKTPPRNPGADDDPADDLPDVATRSVPGFGPVPVRYRHDGWIPDRQLLFIETLAETGCVEAAAKAVGMSRNAAYALRRRPDAQAFRLAWDAATGSAIDRLADAALGRAIHGVPVPIFHGGEQVGERRHFDERLTMFLLRARNPVRYGKWRDAMEARQQPDAPSFLLHYRIARLVRVAWRAFDAAWRNAAPAPPERERTFPDIRRDDDADDAAAEPSPPHYEWTDGGDDDDDAGDDEDDAAEHSGEPRA